MRACLEISTQISATAWQKKNSGWFEGVFGVSRAEVRIVFVSWQNLQVLFNFNIISVWQNSDAYNAKELEGRMPRVWRRSSVQWYLGLIAQVVIAAVDFTFVNCKSLSVNCLTQVLVTEQFDATCWGIHFVSCRGKVASGSFGKDFGTGVRTRRTILLLLVGGTVIPTHCWQTLVALETISCN